MNIKIGYMPDFKEDLMESIRFCKKNFDFLELTVFPEKEDYYPIWQSRSSLWDYGKDF